MVKRLALLYERSEKDIIRAAPPNYVDLSGLDAEKRARVVFLVEELAANTPLT